MVYTQTDICNLGLGHLAVTKKIANLETEQSQEARVCRSFFGIALEQALRDFPWPFATRFLNLALLEENPTPEWGYSYQYPSDCLALRRILSGRRVDHEDSEVPYRLAYGDTGTIILTDQPEACMEYTVRVTDTTRYPADFVMALSLLFASLVAPSLARDDSKLGERALQLYAAMIAQARANAVNELRRDKDPEPEMIRARW